MDKECKHPTCGEKCRRVKKEKKRYKIKVRPGYKIPKRSKKRVVEDRRYNIKRLRFLTANPVCQFKGCCNPANDLHHGAKRGKNYMDESTWWAMCRKHHDWIHDHPKEARELGYLITK